MPSAPQNGAVVSREKTPGGRYTWLKADFIAAFRKLADQTMAAATIGVTLRAVRYRKQQDADFRQDVEEVRLEFAHKLLGSAMKRAIDGAEKQRWRVEAEIVEKKAADKKTGTGEITRKRVIYEEMAPERVYSTGLTIFMLKGNFPQLFTETAMRARATGDDEGEVRELAKTELRNMSQEGRDALRVFLTEQRKAEDATLAEARVAESQTQYQDEPGEA